jgi:hypothetical protein
MPRIYVPPSIKNKAMNLVAEVAGAATTGAAVGGAAKLVKEHHDKVVKRLKDEGHTHVVKEDHDKTAPQGHELLSHTG